MKSAETMAEEKKSSNDYNKIKSEAKARTVAESQDYEKPGKQDRQASKVGEEGRGYWTESRKRLARGGVSLESASLATNHKTALSVEKQEKLSRRRKNTRNFMSNERGRQRNAMLTKAISVQSLHDSR